MLNNGYEEGFKTAIELVIATTEERGFLFFDDEQREEFIDLIKTIKCPTDSGIKALSAALQKFGTRSR